MKKFFLILAVVFLLLISAIIAAPFIFQEQLNEFILKEINKNDDITISYSDPKVRIFKHFPDITISVNSLALHPKDITEDVLFSSESVLFSFDLLSVIRGNKSDLNRIGLETPFLRYDINAKGLSNWDFLLNSETSSDETSLNFTIEEYYINNGHVVYRDETNQIYAELSDIDHGGSGDFESNLFTLISNTSAQITKLDFDKKTYLVDTRLNIKSSVDVDLDQDLYTLKRNDIQLNDLKVAVDGSIKNDDLTRVDLSFESNKNSFADLLSLSPAFSSSESLSMSGDVKMSGEVSGAISDAVYPAFSLSLNVDEGVIRDKKTRLGIEKLSCNVKVDKTGADLNTTVIDIPDFSFLSHNNPVTGSFQASNLIKDPYYNFSINGALDLSDIETIYSNHEVRDLEGKLDMDMFLKAYQSQLSKENLAKIDAGGKLQGSAIEIESDDLPGRLMIENMSMEFQPGGSVLLKNAAGTLGKSDFSVVGNISNFFSYLLAEGTLNGNLTAKSNFFDVNEWQTPNEAAESEVYLIPDNLNLKLQANISEVLYDNITLNTINGKLRIKSGQLFFDNCSASVFGGKMAIDGMYSTLEGKPSIDLVYDIKTFNINSIVEKLDLVNGYFPVASYIEGTVSSNMSLQGDLTPDMLLDLSSLSGNGIIKVPQASFDEIPILKKLADVTKLKLDSWELKDLWTAVKFVKGKIVVEPFDIKYREMKMFVQGENGLDQSINYKIKLDVPSDKLGQAKSIAESWLKKNPIPGLNQVIPEMVRFNIDVTGTFKSPDAKIVKIERGDQASTKSIVKETISKEIEKKKEELKEEAEKQIDKAKKEVETKKEEIKEEVKKEVDEKKEEAEKKVEKEIEDAKEKAKEKLKEKFKFP